MKKLIVTVLSGILLMGFVSCNSGGSKEYKETKAILDRYEAAIDNATSCEEITQAQQTYNKDIDEFRKTPKYPGKNQLNYDGKDRMSDEEIDNYSQLWVQIEKKYSEKKAQLCE